MNKCEYITQYRKNNDNISIEKCEATAPSLQMFKHKGKYYCHNHILKVTNPAIITQRERNELKNNKVILRELNTGEKVTFFQSNLSIPKSYYEYANYFNFRR